MKRILLSIFLLIGITASGYYFYSLSIREAVVFPVTRNKAVNAVPGNVKVLSCYEQIVKTQIGGKIKSIKFPSGTGKLPVKKDEILAELDTQDIDRDIEYLRIRLNAVDTRQAIGSHLEKEIENSKQDLEHLSTLAKHNQYPEAELKKRTRELARLERLYNQEKLNHVTEKKLIEIELEKRLSEREKMTIKAPFDGVLIETYVVDQDFIWAGNNIAKIIIDEYLVEVSINEEDFSGTAVDQPVMLSFLGHPDKLFQGKVTYLFPTSNADTKRRSIHVATDAPKEILSPGMTGQASIIKDIHENVLVVPRRALAGNFAFSVDKNGRVKIKKVETGFSSIDHIEVLSGLEEGDIVIIEDLLCFKDNQQIKVNKEALKMLEAYAQ